MVRQNSKIEWIKDHKIWKEIDELVRKLDFKHVDTKRIICFRSNHSVSRAKARIWSFPRIWQLALKLPSYYIIEVLSQHFDSLSPDDKKRVLIHELLHIPRNFSGSLLPHKSRGKRIDAKRVEALFKKYKDLC